LEHKEYRQELLLRLQEAIQGELSTTDKKRIRTIIEAAQLLDTVSHRDVAGKHFSEIENDAKFFKEVAEKAKLILEQLDR